MTHLEDVNMSYFEHMKFSASLSKLFIEGAIKALIHAFLPETFITSSTDISKQLQGALHHRSKL